MPEGVITADTPYYKSVRNNCDAAFKMLADAEGKG